MGYVARQVDVPPEAFAAYDWGSRTINFSRRDRDSTEVAMLSLHLLQLAVVHINTLLLQRVISDNHWTDDLDDADRRAITPLFSSNCNPYGRFELDLENHIDLAPAV